MDASYQQVPQQLKDPPNWVGWKSEIREGEPTKIPYNTKTGGHAMPNNSSTWTTFEQAVEAADVLNGGDYKGIGFMLKGTLLAGIDFDNAIHDGVADAFVLEILRLLGNPYCELSPSGTGLHAFVECPALPAGKRKLSKKHDGIEIYHGQEGGRFFTVTGQQFSGDGIPKIDDIGLPYFLITQNRNAKFKSLWMGDTSAYGDDHSSADYALMCELAQSLKGDRTLMEKYFSASKLARPEKWFARPDYRERTITAALEGKSFNNPTTNSPATDVAAIVTMISRTASSIKPSRLKWLWEKRIPLGKIALFAGNPDNGKSLSANAVAASVTTGRPFPDYPNMIPPSDVLMMLGEDDVEDTAIPRLMAAGADLSKIHLLEGVMRGNKEGDVRLDVDMQAVETKFKEFPNTRLLIIDPISNFLGDTNMFAEQDARAKVLVPLRKLGEKYGVAVLIVMHLNKKKDLDAISRVGGCMAFIGIARAAWLFQRDEADEDGRLSDNFTMSKMKSNLTAASEGGLSYKIEFNRRVFDDEDGAVGAPYVVWGSAVHKTADQALGTGTHEVGRPKGSNDKLKDAGKFLQTALADGRKPQTELFSDANGEYGITKATLRRAKDDLHIRSVKDGKTWYWELSPMNATRESVTAAGQNTEPSLTTIEVRL